MGETSDHGWHDDAQTGALLLRANASPSYVARYLSANHLQQAYRLDAGRDEHADAPLNNAVAGDVQAVNDAVSLGRNGVQSLIAAMFVPQASLK